MLLADIHNPKVKFNISKYYEYKYGMELCEVDTRDLDAVQKVLHELDVKAIEAMEDPENVKRSPLLSTIDLVL